jgi:hypothetical protein
MKFWDLNQFQRFCDSFKHQPAKRMRCSRDLNLQTLGFEDQQFNTSLKNLGYGDPRFRGSKYIKRTIPKWKSKGIRERGTKQGPWNHQRMVGEISRLETLKIYLLILQIRSSPIFWCLHNFSDPLFEASRPTVMWLNQWNTTKITCFWGSIPPFLVKTL